MIKELQYKNSDFVRKNSTQEMYYKKLKENVQNILGKTNDL